MKNKKKFFIIIGSLALVLLLCASAYFIFFNDKEDKKEDSSLKNNVEVKVDAPAESTEELLEEMDVVKIENVTKDEIVFSDDVDIEENDKVAVWIYSKPKFLGYFEVIVKDGVKKIEGLEEALKNISIESGEHNIAITKEDGKPIGYIDVYIKDNGKLSEPTKIDEEEKEEENEQEKTSTKEVTETEEINFETTRQDEVNMANGTTSVVQAGQKGQKKVTYKVTYDSNGKEISREKKSEKVTKEPVNQIEKVGTSDFNINSDKITGNLIGFMCTEEDSLTNPDGGKACDDTKSLKSFNVALINDIAYLYMVDNVIIAPVKISEHSGMTYSGTYQGVLHYFDSRGGDGAQEPLTMEVCNRYGLKCGAW